MATVAGNSKRGNGTGAGRTKGTPNKSTAQAREAIALLVEGNISKLQGWIDQIAADDPKAAVDTLVKLLEYHVPKLARTELAGHMATEAISIQFAKSDQEVIDRWEHRIREETLAQLRHNLPSIPQQ